MLCVKLCHHRTYVFLPTAQMSFLFFGKETIALAWLAIFNFEASSSGGDGVCVGPFSPRQKFLLTLLSPIVCVTQLAVTFVLEGVVPLPCQDANLFVIKRLAKQLFQIGHRAVHIHVQHRHNQHPVVL